MRQHPGMEVKRGKDVIRKISDLLERIKLTHGILNELRGRPLPVLQKNDQEIDAEIRILSERSE